MTLAKTQHLEFFQHIMKSPIGDIEIVADAEATLHWLGFHRRQGTSPHETIVARADAAPVRHVVEQLNEYFAGQRQSFDLKLAEQGTVFQRAVWERLRAIPFAETTSYGELARQLGRPNAARAVGRANAVNPIAIIVPCHRVIGGNGTLTGYAGGLDLKHQLLLHERMVLFGMRRQESA